MRSGRIVQIIAYLICLALFLIAYQIRYSIILERHEQFAFLPEAVFRILTVVLFLLILFIKIIMAVKHPVSTPLSSAGLACAMILFGWVMHAYPADMFPMLYLLTEEAVLFFVTIRTNQQEPVSDQ